MTQTAIDLIARAGAEGWKELDLSGLGLKVLPEEIANLVQLQSLKLGGGRAEFRSGQPAA
ncbi:hypothetical protein [Haliangium sp. UPWRP_2]|uniref:hypothetical protein n=1 Tax=Haliangium sp. UPWRP_2 TaxID=1931276 RepID=UPI000D0D01D0|nr:hypothetical protein [Haliangium sp. UPWRP_2]PSM30902.1 hypothetical protein BVG81_008135 [Haliangium sp. UPWRP_2]